MRKPVFIAAALLVLASGAARAQDKMVLQLKWVTQAQFAGYYVAKNKGNYAARSNFEVRQRIQREVT